MGEFSLWHLIVILVVVLIFFGPSRLPGLGNSIGKAIRGFKEGIKGVNDPISGDEEKNARTNHEALPPAQDQSKSQNSTAEKDKNKA